MAIEFTKLQGAGNDYIAIDGRAQNLNWPKIAVEMSKPAFGVGSDGIVLVQNSTHAQIRMRVYNPDGSEAEMSGNGIRLFTKFVVDKKIALPNNNKLTIETGGGVRSVWPSYSNGKVVSAKVGMGKAQYDPKEIPILKTENSFSITVKGKAISLTCLSIGNPHAVTIIQEDVAKFPLTEIGPIIETHKTFPNRINFEIVNIIDRKAIRARIFERGVGETLSSGTGSTASAAAARFLGLVDDNVKVFLDGGELNISWDKDEEIYLEGPAIETFTGSWPD